MIEIHTHRVDSSTIDVTDLKEIKAKKAFKTDTPETCYREVQFIDEDHNMITLRLYANNIDNLEINEEK
jgi:hypothetical protein